MFRIPETEYVYFYNYKSELSTSIRKAISGFSETIGGILQKPLSVNLKHNSYMVIILFLFPSKINRAPFFKLPLWHPSRKAAWITLHLKLLALWNSETRLGANPWREGKNVMRRMDGCQIEVLDGRPWCILWCSLSVFN